MFKNVNQVIFSTCLVMLTACSSSNIESTPVSRITMVTSGDLSSVASTYAWHASMFSVHTANKIDEQNLKIHLRGAVDKVMAEKGYQVVNYNDSPQMTIGFGMALASEMSDAEILAKAGLVPGLATQGVDSEHEKGSVLIALFNPLVEQPFWRVLAQGFTEPNNDMTQREARFDSLARIMLSSVPKAG
ncbi:DUF4136 domain-containing protein [Shewanella sp. OMA3-2]|uniref:DUF4136 domain-containing protein n=1 Tax=Shewanella sp. OMA3-2 TaxID=2908650 RepID=UPI001F1D159C|nr:DUF4136 domain-containing protein [Shewanella sp. OMA3-2]UJF21105.1 DUF4136 domain-containing protein [Shewanella sp. OMA3-2]